MAPRRGYALVDLVLIPYLYILLPIISSSQSACPSHCTCDRPRHLVDCENAGLSHIPWNLPDPLGLTHLDLSGNEITMINAQILYKNLKYLDLSENKITHITEGYLSDLPQLESLTLKHNHISNLTAGVFRDMTSLLQLDLSHNELTSLTIPLFRDLSNLDDLSLAGNLITNISESAFAGLTSLSYLNLEDNRLTTLDSYMFDSIRSLKSLNLGYNRIERLQDRIFQRIPLLRELRLEDNNIVEISDGAFEDHDPNSFSQLEKLKLRNNRLNSVPTGALSRLNNLESLDFSQNPITELQNSAFQGLNHLRTVQINAMPLLHTVHDFAISELANLLTIEMHSNHKLVFLSDRAFVDTPLLRRVDLHANALETLSVTLLDWMSLEVLDLRYNAWRCDCHLAWLPEVLQARLTNSTVYLSREVKCYSPESLASRPISSLGPDDISSDCSLSTQAFTSRPEGEKFQDNIMIAIMCTVGGVLVVVIVILMCKYGGAYRTAYAPAMDQYVYRNPSRDVEKQKVPEIEGDMSMARGLRSSLSSSTGIGVPKEKRRLYRVRFAEAGDQKVKFAEATDDS